MWKQVAVLVVAGAVTLIGGALGYLHLKEPNALPPQSVQVPLTAEVIARGEYLFTAVADCDGCHSHRDTESFGMPVLQSKRACGVQLPAGLRLPGRVVAPNITPDVETGIGAWTDGEKIRAIREGIGRNGEALFPIMPYAGLRRMSDSDVQALVAFMNTLPAVKNPLPRTELHFPVNLLVKERPAPSRDIPEPNRGSPIEYGAYLAAIAGCVHCHSQDDNGSPVPGREFAGGKVFGWDSYAAVSANITPDMDTGIGRMSEEAFVERFHSYRKYLTGAAPKMRPGNFTPMPWLSYARMSSSDLAAIYAYLRTVPPVRSAVDTHPGQ